MKYLVPVYKLNQKEELIGKVIVEKTSTGIFEISTGKKIRITTGIVGINEMRKKNYSCYVKHRDLNGSNLVISKSKSKNIYPERIYNSNEYKKQAKKIKKILN